MAARDAERAPQADRGVARLRRHLGLHRAHRATLEEGQGRRGGDERLARRVLCRAAVGRLRPRCRRDQVGWRRRPAVVRRCRTRDPCVPCSAQHAAADEVRGQAPHLVGSRHTADVGWYPQWRLRFLPRRRPAQGARHHRPRRKHDRGDGDRGRSRRGCRQPGHRGGAGPSMFGGGEGTGDSAPSRAQRHSAPVGGGRRRRRSRHRAAASDRGQRAPAGRRRRGRAPADYACLHPFHGRRRAPRERRDPTRSQTPSTS